MSISGIFIPNSLCVFSQIKDIKHIEQNFHSVARVLPRVGFVGAGGGESKTLAWGFAMGPHRLRALVLTAVMLSKIIIPPANFDRPMKAPSMYIQTSY